MKLNIYIIITTVLLIGTLSGFEKGQLGQNLNQFLDKQKLSGETFKQKVSEGLKKFDQATHTRHGVSGSEDQKKSQDELKDMKEDHKEKKWMGKEGKSFENKEEMNNKGKKPTSSEKSKFKKHSKQENSKASKFGKKDFDKKDHKDSKKDHEKKQTYWQRIKSFFKSFFNKNKEQNKDKSQNKKSDKKDFNKKDFNKENKGKFNQEKKQQHKKKDFNNKEKLEEKDFNKQEKFGKKEKFNKKDSMKSKRSKKEKYEDNEDYDYNYDNEDYDDYKMTNKDFKGLFITIIKVLFWVILAVVLFKCCAKRKRNMDNNSQNQPILVQSQPQGNTTNLQVPILVAQPIQGLTQPQIGNFQQQGAIIIGSPQ